MEAYAHVPMSTRVAFAHEVGANSRPNAASAIYYNELLKSNSKCNQVDKEVKRKAYTGKLSQR